MQDLSARLGPSAAIVAGLVVGLLLAALFLLTRPGPQRGEAGPRAPTLTVIEVHPMPFRLEARGHGVARPAESWEAIANVSGRVVERHPDLESGSLLEAGTLLLALDSTRYELALAGAEAELLSLEAEQEQLEREERNSRRLLALERERLALSEKRLERVERLAEQDVISRARRDEQRSETVARRSAVASLENRLALVPARRKSLEARSRSARTRIDQAGQDLRDTRFEAPYDLRIGEVGIELHQYAVAGRTLFRADGVEAAEVEVHVPLAMARRLMGSVARPATATAPLEIDGRLDLGAIEAEVELGESPETRWPARVVGVARGLDPVTRTARIVLRVERPYADIAPPLRPALQPGMYVRGRLSAPSPQPLLAVPGRAVHAGEVYRVAEGERLERREVEVAFEQNELAVLRSGLSPGDRVIVDDPIPALEGMALRPTRDEELEEQLRRRARGEAP